MKIAVNMELMLSPDASPTTPCDEPLGMENGMIMDSQVTASSRKSVRASAPSGRLGLRADVFRTGAWSAKTNDNQQWLQVDFGETVKITGVATQGRQDADQWVKSYTLEYSRDGISWLSYNQSFTGNSDRNTIVSHQLSPPIIARFVKTHPKTWNNTISLREEFYGCRSGFCIPVEDCAAPLGMVDRSINDSQITASSSSNSETTPPYRGRLYLHFYDGKKGAWVAQVADMGQFLQVDLARATKITRIATQGRHDTMQYVKSYRLSYSLDNGYYKPYANRQILAGNTDNNGVHVNILQQAIITRYIRVQPVTWYGYVSMRLELYGCHDGFSIPSLPSCQSKLSMSDDQMTASSQASHASRPQNARLHLYASAGRYGAWTAKYSNIYQFFELQFRRPTQITRIATQGRQDASQWVKSYLLQYSMDGGIFTEHKENGTVKIFAGNTDRYTVVSHVISPPIIAMYIRVYPTTWQSLISMRLEFYGCQTGFRAVPAPVCVAPLGLRSGNVTDAMITASSYFGDTFRPANGRLHFQGGIGGSAGAWSAKTNDVHQWFQVDFSQIVIIQRVATQGRAYAPQWVKSYSLEYSRDGVFWNDYQQDGNKTILGGNVDQHSVVIHDLEPAIITRFIRIRPVTWYGFIVLRAEFYGCKEGFVVPPTDCADALGMENKNISDSRLTASSMYNGNHGPSRARLRISREGSLIGAWVAKYFDQEQWLQIDLGQVTNVTRIAIQGRQDYPQWVTSFTLSYSLSSNGYFETYNDSEVFDGNRDRNTIVGHVLDPPIIARVIRIHPRTWQTGIAMRAELYGCTSGFVVPVPPTCETPVVVNENQFSASSEYNAAHRSANGLLYHRAGGGRTGAWSVRFNNANQYLQVKFTNMTQVTRISTQGRQDTGQWVKTYTLEYSLNGALFVSYRDVSGNTKVFVGNNDKHSVVSHVLDPPIIARYIRVRPVSWHVRISMRVQLYGCTKGFVVPPTDCADALGMENKNISDSRLTASSMYNGNHGPSRARLRISREGSLIGAWVAKYFDQEQWLQIDLGQVTNVTRIATQGRQDYPQWVTSLTLSYSLSSNGYFETYNDSEVFDGNKDRNTIVGHVLAPPIIARVVRIHPRTWQTGIAMRAELYGCTSGFVVPVPPICETPVVVNENQFSASSEFRSAHRAANGLLYHRAGGGRTGAWSAGVSDAFQYLQVKFTHPTKVTRVSTQGRQDGGQWVTIYTLEYSLDEVLFVPYRDVFAFAGNNDRHSVVSHVLDPPIIARYIRVRPVSWYSHISMRVQFYGCTEGFEPPPQPQCVAPLGIEGDSIKDKQLNASSTYSDFLLPSNARLNLIRHGVRGGAWVSKDVNANQWIQVTFESYKTVTRIATQGRQDGNQWTKLYTVQYSQDGKNFVTYKEGREDKEFIGNHDRNTISLNAFIPPIVSARAIRVLPKAWQSRIALRMEMYGCEGEIPFLAKPCNVTMDVGIILDRSGSVGVRHFQESKEFLDVLTDRLNISPSGNHMGIIAFDTTADRIATFNSTQSTAAMKNAIDGIAYTGGMTRIDLGIELASFGLFGASGNRPHGSDVLIVLTNGRTLIGSVPYEEVLLPFRRHNVNVVVVGIGPDVNHAELLKIANGKESNVVHVEKYETLSTKLNTVLELACVKQVIARERLQ